MGAVRGARRRRHTRSNHTRSTPTRSAAAAVVAAAGIVLLAGIAYAGWGIVGSGSGTAATSTTVPLTLSAGSPTALLYPGGSSDVLVTISNPNPSSIVVRSFTLDATQGTGGFSADANHSGCASSVFTFTPSTNAGNGWTVPAQTGGTPGTLAVTLTAALGMRLDAANACQGVVPLVYLTAGSS
ncbi:hypothetical protein B0I08_10724 [Glaciihabitans tibetensis]|uniref:Uncharacterized protein n=1 Tax=Glaciihabitans tibetensis TaxID=1266600 RepID=A0A2T0VAE7_9MICO|nr:hypothetical protein [Glaciihabitans tibetensis]PRY67131.1 hypothetical protein B0I08_10724 [Glaciihabitans tibetensis]